MNVLVSPEVQTYMLKLVCILYEKGYFSFEDDARKYVKDLYDDIKTSLPIRQHKPAPEFFKSFVENLEQAENLEYAVFKKNKRTSWYVFFTTYEDEETGDDIYLVCYIKTIPTYAFSGCNRLSLVIIGNSVTSIGTYAFYNCTRLEHVYSYNTTPPLAYNNSTFSGVPKSTCILHVLPGVESDYAIANGWKEFTKVELIFNVPEITTSSLLEGIVGIPYHQTLSGTDAIPITWSLVNGSLPDDLNLSDEGVISGTPTMAGEKEYTEWIAEFKASHEWGLLDVGRSMELSNADMEMQSIMGRIAQSLDYFGNPFGWAPMLSFEAYSAAFGKEIEHAINVMYLSYWLGKEAENNENLRKAKADAVGLIEGELGVNYDEVNRLMVLINQLEQEAKRANADNKRTSSKCNRTSKW